VLSAVDPVPEGQFVNNKDLTLHRSLFFHKPVVQPSHRSGDLDQQPEKESGQRHNDIQADKGKRHPQKILVEVHIFLPWQLAKSVKLRPPAVLIPPNYKIATRYFPDIV